VPRRRFVQPTTRTAAVRTVGSMTTHHWFRHGLGAVAATLALTVPALALTTSPAGAAPLPAAADRPVMPVAPPSHIGVPAMDDGIFHVIAAGLGYMAGAVILIGCAAGPEGCGAGAIAGGTLVLLQAEFEILDCVASGHLCDIG